MLASLPTIDIRKAPIARTELSMYSNEPNRHRHPMRRHGAENCHHGRTM